MSPSANLTTTFNDFLFATVGDDRNNMPLSVASALARLDLDPCDEAAELARMPALGAARRLSLLLDTLDRGRLFGPEVHASNRTNHSDVRAEGDGPFDNTPQVRRSALQPRRSVVFEPPGRRREASATAGLLGKSLGYVLMFPPKNGEPKAGPQRAAGLRWTLLH